MTPILILIVAYIVTMFILSQIFIPHLGIKQKPIEKLPEEIQREINKITKKSKTRKELLKKIVNFQMSKKKSSMMMILDSFLTLFESEFDAIWNMPYIHCHHQTYILRELLLKTGKFKDEDLKLKLTTCYLEIHQYLKVNISETPEKKEYIYVDPFAISLGYKIGEILPFFAYRDMKKRNINWKITHKEFRTTIRKG